jgi:hypothetical protein
MRGNKILVCPEPHGSFEWGYLAGAYLPGVVLERDPTVALKAGKHTYKVYSPGADGKNPKGGYWVLLENEYLAQPATVAYASGDFAKMYSPRMGEELNLLVANLAGTADDHATERGGAGAGGHHRPGRGHPGLGAVGEVAAGRRTRDGEHGHGRGE